LHLAVVNGLCYADLFDEKVLSTNLMGMGLACEHIYKNLSNEDKGSGLADVPQELLFVVESMRPQMGIFLKEFLLPQPNLLKFCDAIQQKAQKF